MERIENPMVMCRECEKNHPKHWKYAIVVEINYTTETRFSELTERFIANFV